MSIRVVATNGEPLQALQVFDFVTGINEHIFADEDGSVTVTNLSHIDYVERNQIAQGVVVIEAAPRPPKADKTPKEATE